MPFSLTISNLTMTKAAATLRDRDSLMQDRVPVKGIADELRQRLAK